MIEVDKIVGVLAPNICLGCGVEGHVLCPVCLETAGEPVPSRCAGCRKLTKDYKTCSSCKSWLGVYSVHVATAYEGIYEKLVHALKFDMKRQASEPIAKMMSENLPDADNLIVCPIPTAPARIRARGFDHSKHIAKSFMKYIDKDWELKYLLKRHSNVRQVGSSRSKRIEQMSEEFYVNNPEEVKDKNILLIDDVTTTGATLAGAAKILKENGANRVYAVIFAQKN